MSDNAKFKEWSEKKLQCAVMLAEGDKLHSEIAEILDINPATISRWKREADFLEYVDELTLKHERHTVAGMLRRIDEKLKYTKVKENDWVKLMEMKIKILGLDKQKLEHNDQNITVQIIRPDND